MTRVSDKSPYGGAVEVARRTMTLFFLVDTSGSMDGSKIGTLNSAVEEVIPEIRKISGENADAAIKIAVLEFSSGARWITPAPMDAGNFEWNHLNADGLTDFGEMCRMLNEKLSRKAFMSDVVGSFAPAIFLLSDGEPTDEYQKELGKLKENNWFKKSIKVAVAIGDDANKDVLAEFTGNKEAVITVHTPEALTKMIRFVSVTASQIGSKSSSVGKGGVDQATNKQTDTIEAIKTTVSNDPSGGVEMANTPVEADNQEDWNW
ncbi:MAG TPA: VWA domain-containing protein [Ruminococcus bromii]|nr:VWA domain-containing protein [Ruminococcus bromii]